MIYKYYSKMRPISPGTFPKSGVVEIVNFDSRKPVQEAGCMAWGYLLYDRELTKSEIYDYELEASKKF